MFGYKLLVPCLVSSLLSAAGSAQAQAFDQEMQLQTFAICVGRLSAVVEHEWTYEGSISEASQRQRDEVVSLVAAIAPEDRSRDILNWRNGAKQAQEALLERARTEQGTADAAWAEERANQLKQECTSLLLS